MMDAVTSRERCSSMSENRPTHPPPQDDWEASVEAELAVLRGEIERLNHELVKQGGRVNVLMRERDERQRHAKGARR
jgi:hypothetical protein